MALVDRNFCISWT